MPRIQSVVFIYCTGSPQLTAIRLATVQSYDNLRKSNLSPILNITTIVLLIVSAWQLANIYDGYSIAQ